VTAEIQSPSVGTIVEVLVTAGTLVATGDELIVVESMKVEIPVPAPCGGRVAAIAVAPGDHVEAGTVLLTLEG
jgi:biotin carboxyl carrier protein